ncbi:MAG TPA: ferrous iron transporter B [Phycisphaerales bacterium]|nr:ferrous iron transporter B [Phycisphaerales bacterium]
MATTGAVLRVALLGNPNTGKTTLFNRLTGLRHKTSNFPGTTLEAREGRFDVTAAGAAAEVVEAVDLPGIYSLDLQQLEAEVCRDVLAGQTALKGARLAEPDGVLLVLDATNLSRNLALAGEALRRRLPTVVVVNMVDLARKQGLQIDHDRLSQALGCPVVPVCARSGEGVDELKQQLVRTVESRVVPTATPPGDAGGLRAWADAAFASSVRGRFSASEGWTDRADRVLTHPLLGTVAFAVIMALVFAGIFWLAQFPMGWIEGLFNGLGSGIDWLWARTGATEGLMHDLLKNGVVAGVGGVVVFIPQICLLFFLISILEDTGYLARAAFVMDRVLRPFGLPGHAFVPLLSSHACALPGIMATRCIPDPKERLATILVAPFTTCSARLPVYVLLTGLLFAGQPLLAGVAFVGCYVLGIVAAMLSALLARRTILRGPARPMALELPSYKRPSLRTAAIAAYDRGLIFLRKAGTAILAVSIVLWWLGAFPKAGPSPEAVRLRESAAAVAETKPERADQMTLSADRVDARYAKSQSMLGRLGKAVEPVLRPLGYDWQLSVGVLASFAAREVFVGTMSIVVAGGEEGDDETENLRIREALATAKRDDGVTPVFTPAACWSLLVYYVLAMQCIPTLVVTAREAGGVKWAMLQLAWMSAVAYAAAWLAYSVASA